MSVHPIAYVRAARYAGLKQTSALVESLRDLSGDPQDVLATLRTHGLIGLLLSIVPDADLRGALSPALVDALDAWRARPRPSSAMFVQGFAKVRDILEAQRIPVLLLKGAYFAERLYGGVANRPQFDVDILVRERDFRLAVRSLMRAGFVGSSYDLHSRTLVVDGWKLDVHRCLRRAPAFRLDPHAMWGATVDTSVAGIACQTLSDEWYLVLLVLGAFEDLGQGMAKLRQLLDVYLLLRAIDADFAWNDFFERRQAENLVGVTANILRLVTELFEAQAELPRLGAALARRADLLTSARRATAIDLVFAARKSPESFAWFARIYPGSVRLYLAWFWYGGFPGNLKDFDARRLTSSLRVAFGGTTKSSARA